MASRWTPAYDGLFDPDHELAMGEPSCPRWAWLDLCHMARYEDGVRIIDGVPVTLKRGELIASLRFLAQRWMWSVKRVRTFLELLQGADIGKLMVVRGTPRGTVYRVVTYDTWANPGHTKGHTGGTPEAHQRHKEQQGQQGQQGGEKPAPKSRARDLPSDWEPTPDHAKLAFKLDLDVDEQSAAFVDYCRSSGKQYVDHHAGFRNFLRKAREFADRDAAKRGKPYKTQADRAEVQYDSAQSVLEGW